MSGKGKGFYKGAGKTGGKGYAYMQRMQALKDKKTDDELLGKKGLKRVARQAGVGLFNHFSFGEVRFRIRRWLGRTLWDAGTVARHMGRRTLKKADLDFALQRQGISLCG